MKDKQKAVIAMLISALAFSLMGVFVKLAGDVPVMQKAVFRAGTVTVFSYWMLRANRVALRPLGNVKLLIVRSTLGTIGIVLNYYALDHLILSDANVIFRLNTVFVILFSWLFLKEKITRNQMMAIIMAFVGVLFIMKPEFSFELIPYTVAILGAASAAGAYTTLRPLGKTTHPSVIVFFFACFSFVALLPFVIANFQPMTVMQVVYAILAGLGALGGQYGVTLAYKYAAAKEVSIYNYFGIIFSAVFSIFIFGNVPDVLALVGYVVVFLSGYYIYRLNQRGA